MPNSLGQAVSHLSTNLTEIYTPPCSFQPGSAMVLGHCRCGEPCSILHPLHPALSPSSPHWGSSAPTGPTQPGDPRGRQGTPRNSTQAEPRGLGACWEQRECWHGTAFPLQGPGAGASLGLPLFSHLGHLQLPRSLPRHDPAAGTWQALLSKVELPALPPGHGDAAGSNPGALLCDGAKQGGNFAFLALYVSEGAQSRGTE